MVDWDQVDRLRGKGWDWSRIAEDDRVEFAADPAAGDAGRQLRTLYYQRRSKAKRRASDAPDGEGGGGAGGSEEKPSILLRLGYVLLPMFGIWAVLAFVFPSPVGIFVPWLYLGFLAIIAAAVLLYALFQATVKWEHALRTPLILGIVLGLAAAGTVTVVATFEGCPTLTSTAASAEPNGWERYANPSWTQNGAPVFFFYGSIACPYCSASSWAMFYALRQFGTVSGYVYFHSNPNDVYPDTPEVDLSSATEISPYLALNVYEGTDDNSITTPALPTCQLSSYVTTYDSGGTIPFVVLGGTYVHAGASLVDPSDLENSSTGQAYNYTTVLNQVNAQSGPCWNAIAPAAWTIEAILLKLNGDQGPSVVLQNPNVQSIYAQLH